jgi:Na+/proline symporter
MIGGIAALMSTLDSQLLTVTSLITEDLPRPKKADPKKWRYGILACLAGAGFLMAVFPPETILGFINATTFNGLAVLAPPVIGGLYWKRGNRFGAGAGIILGELGTILFFLGDIRISGIMPVMILVLVSAAAYIIGSLLTTMRTEEDSDPVSNTQKSSKRKDKWFRGMIYTLLLFLGCDFWNWNRTPEFLWGLPLWIWYFFGLGILLSSVFAFFSAQMSRRSIQDKS